MTNQGGESTTMLEVRNAVQATSAAIKLLTAQLEGVNKLFTATREEVAESRVQRADIREKLDAIDKALHRGNGVGAITHRLATVERDITEISDALKAIRHSMDEQEKARVKSRTELIVAIVGAIAAVAASSVALLK